VPVKKILLLAFLALMAFILINRQRVFVRDPLATVYRNNVKQAGVQVYINYSNDVLLVKEDNPGGYRLLVQNWSKMPGTPAELKCVHWMACLTNADRAGTLPMVFSGKGTYDPHVTMTNREISFVDADGAKVLVELR
jgi:hypothetical protein